MEKFTSLTSKVVPVNIKDIDTDMIIPAEHLKMVSRDGFGEKLFERLRNSDPDFPLNKSEFKDAEILVADDNFGCGSSREHAIWALTGWGFKVIISKSFADIFSGNAGKNGLVLVKLSDEAVDSMLEAAQSGDYEVKVDLESQTVFLPSGEERRFDYPEFRKHCILNGLDDIDYIKSHELDIQEFRKNQINFSD